MIDPAVLRPGRLDKVIYVGFPTKEDRADILAALTKVLTQSYRRDLSIKIESPEGDPTEA